MTSTVTCGTKWKIKRSSGVLQVNGQHVNHTQYKQTRQQYLGSGTWGITGFRKPKIWTFSSPQTPNLDNFQPPKLRISSIWNPRLPHGLQWICILVACWARILQSPIEIQSDRLWFPGSIDISKISPNIKFPKNLQHPVMLHRTQSLFQLIRKTNALPLPFHTSPNNNLIGFYS